MACKCTYSCVGYGNLLHAQGMDQQKPKDGFPKSVYAHSGFVASARASLAAVEEHLTAIETASKHTKVILTGHSAGGAVAALLYARLMLNNSCKLSRMGYSQSTNKQLSRAFNSTVSPSERHPLLALPARHSSFSNIPSHHKQILALVLHLSMNSTLYHEQIRHIFDP
jgi:hypothetical protein